MRTILTNNREIKTAISTPRAQIYAVTSNCQTYQIDQARRGKQGKTEVHLRERDTWTSDVITIYKEV